MPLFRTQLCLHHNLPETRRRPQDAGQTDTWAAITSRLQKHRPASFLVSLCAERNETAELWDIRAGLRVGFTILVPVPLSSIRLPCLVQAQESARRRRRSVLATKNRTRPLGSTGDPGFSVWSKQKISLTNSGMWDICRFCLASLATDFRDHASRIHRSRLAQICLAPQSQRNWSLWWIVELHLSSAWSSGRHLLSWMLRGLPLP